MEKLAELAEIEYSQLSNLELGKTNATVSMLYKVCCALEISISELFDDDSLN